MAIAAAPCGQLRVPQGVDLNRRGCEVQNQWSWTVESFANMFANQSTVDDGHSLAERLTHGDFQGRAVLSLILEGALWHSLKK